MIDLSKHIFPPLWFNSVTAVSFLAYAGLVRLHRLHGTLREDIVPDTIFAFLLAVAAYLILIICAEKSAVKMSWIWGGAILFRLLLLFTTPTLSDDVYRYLWDGHVAQNRVSPYAYPIEASELDYLDTPIRALANNTWMASPYQPAAQLIFWGVTAVFPLNPVVLQAIMILFDLLAAWLLMHLLALARLPSRRILIYLWNPLVIVEVAHGAHIDAWMVLLTLLAVLLVWKKVGRNGRFATYLSPFFLALATLTKLLPILLTPILFWHWNWRQRISYGLFTVGLLLPFGLTTGWGLSGELDGRGLFGALRIYGRMWLFNSGLFHWLSRYLQSLNFTDPIQTSKQVIFAIFALLMFAVWLSARQTDIQATLRLMAIPFMGYILLTPTLHPWYILILLIWLPFLPPTAAESPWRWALLAPWLYLSGTLIFSYLTYIDPTDFGELEWVRRLEWWPTLLLLAFVLIGIGYHQWQNKTMPTIE